MFKKMFRITEHRKFNYEPRYYDERKEDLERRIKMAELEAKDEEEFLRKQQNIKFRDKMENASADRRFYSRIEHQKTMSRVRFFFILNILLILTIFAIYKFL